MVAPGPAYQVMALHQPVQMLQPAAIVQQILVPPLTRGIFSTLCMILRPQIQQCSPPREAK